MARVGGVVGSVVLGTARVGGVVGAEGLVILVAEGLRTKGIVSKRAAGREERARKRPGAGWGCSGSGTGSGSGSFPAK